MSSLPFSHWLALGPNKIEKWVLRIRKRYYAFWILSGINNPGFGILSRINDIKWDGNAGQWRKKPVNQPPPITFIRLCESFRDSFEIFQHILSINLKFSTILAVNKIISKTPRGTGFTGTKNFAKISQNLWRSHSHPYLHISHIWLHVTYKKPTHILPIYIPTHICIYL